MSRNLLDIIPMPIKVVGLSVLTAGILNNCAEFMEASGIDSTNSMISLGEMMLLDDDPSNDAAASQMILTYTRIYNKELAAASRDEIIINNNLGNTNPTNFRSSSGAKLPENVVYRNGLYYPASGFIWDNPKILSVKKKKADAPRSLSSRNLQRTPKGFFSGSRIIDYDRDKNVDRSEISNYGRTHGSLGIGEGLIFFFKHGDLFRICFKVIKRKIITLKNL